MSFLYYFAMVLFLILAVVLCGVILVQESKSTGLGASFGGDAGESVFGASTADVLKQFTAWLVVIFFASCVILSLWTASLGRVQIGGGPAIMEEPQG
jgi:preprotein translocase subunit SecG